MKSWCDDDKKWCRRSKSWHVNTQKWHHQSFYNPIIDWPQKRPPPGIFVQKTPLPANLSKTPPRGGLKNAKTRFPGSPPGFIEKTFSHLIYPEPLLTPLDHFSTLLFDSLDYFFVSLTSTLSSSTTFFVIMTSTFHPLTSSYEHKNWFRTSFWTPLDHFLTSKIDFWTTFCHFLMFWTTFCHFLMHWTTFCHFFLFYDIKIDFWTFKTRFRMLRTTFLTLETRFYDLIDHNFLL